MIARGDRLNFSRFAVDPLKIDAPFFRRFHEYGAAVGARHLDQHGATMIPDGNGGVTLVIGNDGGVYKQHVDSSSDFDQTHWGDGANKGFNTLLPYGVAMARDGTGASRCG